MDENHNKWGIFIFFFGKKPGRHLSRLITIKTICFSLKEKICNLHCTAVFGAFWRIWQFDYIAVIKRCTVFVFASAVLAESLSNIL